MTTEAISRAAVDEWRTRIPWKRIEQIQIDLVLSKLIQQIARHPVLGEILQFKGGTCLHKLWFVTPWRYSEDLDYDRLNGDPVPSKQEFGRECQEFRDLLAEVAEEVGMGFEVGHASHRHGILHARFAARFEDLPTVTVKIDLSLFQTYGGSVTARQDYSPEASWSAGSMPVSVTVPDDIIASKVAAIYGRARPRDLFDMWAADAARLVTPSSVAARFVEYMPKSRRQREWTAKLAALSLLDKMKRIDYRDVLYGEDFRYAPRDFDPIEALRVAARYIDAAAQTCKSAKNWGKVLHAGSTATNIIEAWAKSSESARLSEEGSRHRPRPALTRGTALHAPIPAKPRCGEMMPIARRACRLPQGHSGQHR